MSVVAFKEGFLVEAIERPGVQPMNAGAKKLEDSLGAVKPLLEKAVSPVIDAINSISNLAKVENAEIELSLGFEASGSVLLAQLKGEANIKIKITIGQK